MPYSFLLIGSGLIPTLSEGSWYDDQGFRVRRKARYARDGEEQDVEVVQPSMYYGVETRRDLLGRVHPDSGFAVNHIYLNGVRIAEALPDGTAQYFLTDQVDSVKVVVDDAGKIVTRHEYMPFGEDWITEGDEKNAPKYNSQEFDKESGYYFYNARHYDPEIGRFVTPDTVIDGENSTQGWNRFAYCHNNPIRYKDPTGHDVQDAIVGTQKAFEKATCEQAKATKDAWNNGKPLKAAYHAANTLGAAIPAFLLPSSRAEVDVAALTLGTAPAATKIASGAITGGKFAVKGITEAGKDTVKYGGPMIQKAATEMVKNAKELAKPVVAAAIANHDKIIEYAKAFGETFSPSSPDPKSFAGKGVTKFEKAADGLIKNFIGGLGFVAGDKASEKLK